jgi:selT/selW/selH-like putative selenoprotein
LIKGQDGVFEVKIDGERVYSKRDTGRFPNAGEVEELLATRLNA